ncbi:hypothetical protein MYP_4636 [Sporocytophaga myxococcoides]|uniref:Uncharacterized protein n=1 Tax=Sporocytophaga myxococcoides TaxID=153721 RepID=A0A098LK88_9BACT|nr:hypothetical protein [Sporocytophaga myxococcoides]GAL87406.1 hypothetical protein MYP_4636 [Sporocytophaga myxococcoides]
MNTQTKKELNRIRLHNLIFAIKHLPWLHIFVFIISITIASAVFYFFASRCFKTVDANSILTNLLTVNAVFSAILITYLFSRITWSKDRKLETLNEAISLSRKITEFRRILNKLTYYYQVWTNDNATKSLIDYGKFKHIDFYDYRLSMISDYKPKNKELIQELYNHENFKEGQSTLYLAMVSLVRNRNNPEYEFQEELYKDFEHNGLYNIKAVEKWLDCDIFNTIWYWLDQNYNFINYKALSSDKEFILSAASRINKKYEGHELNNELLKELADDFSSHYLKELYIRLKDLKKGVTDLNLLIMTLITVSLIFGVLLPFVLLLISSKSIWFGLIVAILASLNSGLISYFILRFPTLINKELKWT